MRGPKEQQMDAEDALDARDTYREAPGTKNGVIVDAEYWLWIDEQRAAQAEREAAPSGRED